MRKSFREWWSDMWEKHPFVMMTLGFTVTYTGLALLTNGKRDARIENKALDQGFRAGWTMHEHLLQVVNGTDKL